MGHSALSTGNHDTARAEAHPLGSVVKFELPGPVNYRSHVLQALFWKLCARPDSRWLCSAWVDSQCRCGYPQTLRLM